MITHCIVVYFLDQSGALLSLASYCEESLIVLLFVKSEIWKFFRHKSNKTVKFFVADRSHRTEHLQATGSVSQENQCLFSSTKISVAYLLEFG